MTATLYAWFNGELIASPLESASVASNAEFLLNRSNTFGDGVFETLLVSNSKVQLLNLHMQRLSIGLKRLGIDCSAELIQADIDNALTHLPEKSTNHVLKLVVSRGSSVFGYGGENLSINRLTLLKPYQPSNHSSSQLMVCTTRLGLQPAFAGIKHCNRLEQVLAKKEVELQGCDDGLMLDQSGLVIETTSANIFILEAGQLITPPIIDCGVAGVVRQHIIEHADFIVREEAISLERLFNSDGVMLTNSVQGLKLVHKCQKKNGSIHSWPQSDKLTALQQAINSSLHER